MTAAPLGFQKKSGCSNRITAARDRNVQEVNTGRSEVYDIIENSFIF